MTRRLRPPTSRRRPSPQAPIRIGGSPDDRRPSAILLLPHLRQFLLAAALLLVAGCSGPDSSGRTPAADSHAYLLTVTADEQDTVQSLESRYGGEVLMLRPGHVAVIGLSSASVADGGARLLDESETLEENEEKLASDGIRMSGMSHVWGEGMSYVWGEGMSHVWGGGMSHVWGGGMSHVWGEGGDWLWSDGEYGWMPPNSSAWQTIGLERAHAMAPNLGYGVKVAIIDSGVDLDHPALREALAPVSEWRDFYDGDGHPQEGGAVGDPGFGHGTSVAGIVRQVAPRATILPIRVLGPDGSGNFAQLVTAIDWAVSQGADVINLSLGSHKPIRAVEEAVAMAVARGVLVVSSAGNSGETKVTYPAASSASGQGESSRTSVTSLDGNGAKSSFAPYSSSKIELSTIGELIYGPAPDNAVAAWSGTSMAAPQVTGAYALALAERLTAATAELEKALKESASAEIYADGLNDEYDGQLGSGLLDLPAFIGSLQSKPRP